MRQIRYSLSSGLLAALLVAGCQGAPPSVGPTAPPSTHKADLIDSLWALTTLDGAITVADVLEKLDMNADDLDIGPPDIASRAIYGWETRITWKDRNMNHGHPVGFVEISRITSPETYAKADEQFSRQVIWISPSSKDVACKISTETVGARLHIPYDSEYFPGFADVSAGTFYYFRYHGEKTAGYLSVQPNCTGSIEIRKFFVPSQKRASDALTPKEM